MNDWYGNTVVYTSVIGDFENIGRQRMIDGVDYVFFTSGEQRPLEDSWKVVGLDDFAHLGPRRLSKLPKHNPHFFDVLRDYKYAIWIDGDMQIDNPQFPVEILKLMDKGIVFSPHFDGRTCAFGEAMIRPRKYQNEPLDAQVNFYKSQGYEGDTGLFETGVIARDMTDPRVRELGEIWYIHNMVFSYQDQVSLPYVLWKHGFEYSVLPQSFRDYRWVHINAHKSED